MGGLDALVDLGERLGNGGRLGLGGVLQDIVEFQKLMPGQQQIVVQFLEVFEFEPEPVSYTQLDVYKREP